MTAQEFRKIREGMGMTQDDLARLMGISSSMVKHYETGLTPVPDRSRILLGYIEKEYWDGSDEFSKVLKPM